MTKINFMHLTKPLNGRRSRTSFEFSAKPLVSTISSIFKSVTPIITFLVLLITSVTMYSQNKSSKDLSKKIQNAQYYIANKGQWPNEVLFLAKSNNLNYWITRHGVVFDYYKIQTGLSKVHTNERTCANLEDKSIEGQVIKMEIDGSNSNPEIETSNPINTKINYLLGNDRSKWKTNLEAYQEVILKNTITGIDSRYYFDHGNLRYDYVVKPDGDLTKLKFKIDGATDHFVNSSGELIFKTRFGDIKQADLFTYQMKDGLKKEIKSKFVLAKDGEVKFEVANYDKSQNLIIDPIIWGSYLGGANLDMGLSIDVDELTQSVYVAGTTSSTNFPTTTGLYSSSNAGSTDGFVSKLSWDGTTLLASTYIGGSSGEEFTSINVNKSSHNVYITGSTYSSNFPTEPSTNTSSYQGTQDIVVVILDQNLDGPNNNMVYSTYFGGANYERSRRIISDQSSTDNAYYICGTSNYNSASFGTISNLTPLPANNHKSAFVTRVDLSTPANSWVRYFFGTSTDGEIATSLCRPEEDILYVVGETFSTDLEAGGISGNYTFVTPGTNDRNAFISRFDNTGGVVYLTLDGGSNSDQFLDVAAIGSFAWAVGQTRSDDLQSAIGSLSTAPFLDTADILISSFDLFGDLTSNRYYGGNSTDFGNGIKLAPTEVIISGGVTHYNFSTTQCNIPGNLTYKDAIVATLDPTLTTVNYSRTFGGASYEDYAYGLAIANDNDIFIAGYTTSVSSPNYTFPVTSNAYDNSFNSGISDAFVLRLNTLPINITCSSSMPNVCPGYNTVLTGHGADVYTFYDGTTLSSPSSSPFATPNLTSTTTYTVTGYDALDLSCQGQTTITINVGCDCPNAPPGATLYNNPVATTNSLTSITSPIIINGTFTVDDPTTIINNPDIYLLPGAIIDITGTGTLTIDNSTLEGCLVHWDGIKVNDGNTLVVSNGSNLKHMINGVQAVGTAAIVHLSESNFIDNANQSVYLENADFSSSSSFIEKNVFKTTVSPGLWAPYNANLQSRCGIYINDCYDVKIGDLTNGSSGNDFQYLYNGIYALWGFNNSISNVGIYNNSFLKIEDVSLSGPLAGSTVLNQAFTTPKGACIFGEAIYSNPGLNELNLDVRNINGTPTSFFTNSDKAIVGNQVNLTAKKLRINNCILGIVNNSNENIYDIQENWIAWGHLGIHINNNYSQATIDYNDVWVINPILYSTFPSLYRAPIGIRLTDAVTSNPTLSYIRFNNIRLYSIAGIGIDNNHGKPGQVLDQNTIDFYTTSSAPASGWDNDMLWGIRNYHCDELVLTENRVNGIDENSYPSAFYDRKSLGFFFDKCPNSFIMCNKVRYTGYGFYAIENNTGSYVHQNKCRNNIWPWWFDGTTANYNSTFGTIGGSLVDDANDFLFGANSSLTSPTTAIPTNPNAFKVFRNICTGTAGVIYTKIGLLDPLESSATAPLTEYAVSNNNLIGTDDCNPDATFGMKASSNLFSSEEIQQFINIATNQISYSNYVDVGKWMDNLKLFEIICDNPDLLSYSELQTFYTNMQNSNVHKFYIISKTINEIRLNGVNKTEQRDMYFKAFTDNSSIISSLSFEQDLKKVNFILLKFYLKGYDILSSDEKTLLDEFSHRCAYEFGASVIHARTIWSYINPTEVFDDRKICFLGSNKGDYNNSYELASFAGPQVNINSKSNELSIYPNPSNGAFEIRYDCLAKGRFILTNLEGKIIFETELEEANLIHKISLPLSLKSGLYLYRCSFNGVCEDKFGKLSIEH